MSRILVPKGKVGIKLPRAKGEYPTQECTFPPLQFICVRTNTEGMIQSVEKHGTQNQQEKGKWLQKIISISSWRRECKAGWNIGGNLQKCWHSI